MLINLRNALMAGKRLPYDNEVEFLESTGTQYIETPYTVNTATDKIRVTFQGLDTANYKWFFGIYDNSGAIRLASGSGDMANRRTVAYGSNTNYVADSITYNRPHELVADSNGLSIDGTSQFSFASFASTSKFCLFTFGRDGSPASTVAGKVRIFAFQHWRNGVLISDYIPVRKGTVGYLYDRVSGKLFDNAGTGDFVLGPDVVPVEYLQSNRYQYINTGVMGSTPLKVTVDFKWLSGNVGNDRYILGSNGTGDTRLYFGTYDSQWMFGCGTFANATEIEELKRYRAVCDFTTPTATLTIDGAVKVQINQQNEIANDYELRLFGRNNRGSTSITYNGASQIYSALFESSGAKLRNFLPVRVGTEGAMMDVLTRRIYRNQGSGAFGYGNDLKYPIPAA